VVTFPEEDRVGPRGTVGEALSVRANVEIGTQRTLDADRRRGNAGHAQRRRHRRHCEYRFPARLHKSVVHFYSHRVLAVVPPDLRHRRHVLYWAYYVSPVTGMLAACCEKVGETLPRIYPTGRVLVEESGTVISLDVG